jgi:hypothetical protein
MGGDNKDVKKDKAYYQSHQAKILKTYEREGSDFLDQQSE